MPKKNMGEKTAKRLKDVELKLISELLKNCRRSDRQLAKAVGTSQPTISRLLKKLEKRGYFREFTLIPDFAKLGYRIMGITLVKFRKPPSRDSFQESMKTIGEIEHKNPHASLMAVNVVGSRHERVFITLYKDYSAYSKAMQLTRAIPYVDVDSLESYLVDLSDSSNYRVLSMLPTARHILLDKNADSGRT